MKTNLIGVSQGFYLVCLGLLLYSCSTSPETTAPKSHTVTISGMQFLPAELSVQKGDTVVFINKDIVQHNVAEEKAKAWSSQPLSTGQSYKMVANESADYYCTFHPVMKGKLLVN